jgi:hypothetical protein
MGTTFVTLSREVSGKEPGFWMRDGMLELWLDGKIRCVASSTEIMPGSTPYKPHG